MKRGQTIGAVCTVAALLLLAGTAHAQTGVDDDRVSLPEGPGSLEGVGDDVEIDPNMGAMSHSIPIRLPAGFPGASPSLALTYSSSAGSGVVGIGWSMKTPTIERMTSRGAPEYTTDDLFDADGNEVTFVGIDGADRIYRSRFEKSFERYRWKDAGGGDAGYWVVEHTDGSRSYFGADAAGNPVASARSSHNGGTANYALVETVDPYGHSVRYAYTIGTGTVPLLTSISWLDDGQGADLYSVDISYGVRSDTISNASRGFEERCSDRVQSIRVHHQSEIVREYLLTYQDDVQAGGFSRLQRVQHYGVGGQAAGELYPIAFDFEYSQALGVECTGDACDTPVIVQMGTLPGAVNLGGGRATLVDINNDGLPDVLDTTQATAHQFFLNTLAWDGTSFSHTFAPSQLSTSGSGGSFGLGGANTIQIFDVNGDGRSDLLNTQTGSWLQNGGDGDWTGVSTLGDVSAIIALDFSQTRFIDLDDDKRVDMLSSTTTTTTLYQNNGDSFSTRVIEPLGVAFGLGSQIQFADMNGDGLSDPFELRDDGTVRYRLNYGRGKWADTWRTIPGLSISPTDRDRADVEDINGDGIADIVVVNQTEIKYAINRNGDRFDPFVTITSDDIEGALPERVAGVTVLYSDMNGNGSEDVVWFTSNGQVTYLELFPRRPNLITRIDNGIGSVQEVSYTTAAEEAARAAFDGNPWERTLQISMQLVSSVDRYVSLTGSPDGSGLHEVTEFTYRDGYYDGLEKQYRGFERVESVIVGDATQEANLTRYRFDVGAGGMEHRNGLQLEVAIESGGRLINHTTNTYTDCILAEVPTPSEQAAAGLEGIYFPCLTQTDVAHQEGLEAAGHKTVRTVKTYDGYGNVTVDLAEGDIEVTGDELTTETEYVIPGHALAHGPAFPRASLRRRRPC